MKRNYCFNIFYHFGSIYSKFRLPVNPLDVTITTTNNDFKNNNVGHKHIYYFCSKK